jgi:hypothetical protein
MAGITMSFSILMLNVNGLNSPSKDTIWQTGLKRKTQKYVVYEKPNLLAETDTVLLMH